MSVLAMMTCGDVIGMQWPAGADIQGDGHPYVPRLALAGRGQLNNDGDEILMGTI